MINKTFRLFISSTFSDFLAERAILNNDIFTAVDDHCQSRGYNFQLIDLRWGVNTEAALNQQTISICLDEVRRCRDLSPRPNFLIMAGERYGWIPLPTAIPAARFAPLPERLSSEDRALLERWYLPDDNALQREYYLKSRSGIYADEAVWAAEEAKLQAALLTAAEGLWPETELARLRTSATEQEILEGFLADADGSDNVVAVLRRGYPDRDADPTRALSLQERIAAQMHADGNAENILTLVWNDEEYLSRFRDRVTELLLKNISAEIDRLEAASSGFSAPALPPEVLFRGRQKELQTLSDYIADETANVPFLLLGDSGSGKSTLLGQLARSLDCPVFFASFGMDEDSYTLERILQRLRAWCVERFAAEVGEADSLAQLAHSVLRALEDEDEPIAIILDAVDMLHDLPDIHENVFAAPLSGKVRLILSSVTAPAVMPLLPRNTRQFAIDRFDRAESLALFDEFLARKGRRVADEAQRRRVTEAIGGGTLPLQVKLMAELCAGWHSGENTEALPSAPEETALLHLRSMFEKFGHDRALTLYALALVTVSPKGIGEEELQRVLLRFPQVRQHFAAEDRYGSAPEKLPFVVWSRLFHDLSGCLTLERLNGAIVVKFVHQVFHRAFRAAYGDICREAVEELCGFYLEQKNYLNEKARIPNVRRAVSLLPLLESAGRQAEALAALGDVRFVDSLIRSGGMEEFLRRASAAQKLTAESAMTAPISALFSCVTAHLHTLRCYPAAFLDCCSYSGLLPREKVGIFPAAAAAVRAGKPIFFPYSVNALLAWELESDRFAAAHGAHIYICDGKTGSELQRIYLLSEDEFSDAHCVRLCWLGKDGLACATESGEVFIYGITDTNARCLRTLKYAPNSFLLRYLPKCGLLVYAEKRRICAIEPFTGRPAWEKPITDAEHLDLSVADDGRILLLKNQAGRFFILNGATGGLLRAVRHSTDSTVQEMSSKKYNYMASHVDGQLWFIFETGIAGPRRSFLLHDERSRRRYLLPPMFTRMVDCITGGKYALLRYPDRLISVDLTTLDMRTLPLNDIRSAVWIRPGESFAVLSDNGLIRLRLEDLQPLPGLEKCHSARENPFTSASLSLKTYNALSEQMSLIPWYVRALRNLWLYPAAFHSAYAGDNTLFLMNKPTLAVSGPGGLRAAAYEARGAVGVYDAAGKPLFLLEGLDASVNNTLLRLRFSGDGRYLLLWCAERLIAADLKRGRLCADISLKRRPALVVDFEGAAALRLTLCNGSTHVLPLGRGVQKGRALPKKLTKKRDLSCFGPHSLRPDGSRFSFTVEEKLSFTEPWRTWMHSDRIYPLDPLCLHFTDGSFRMENGGVFSAAGYDFRAALQSERSRDETVLEGYLREKNDLSAGLYAPDGRHLLLVSPLLGSVILFDRSEMRVAAAYRHHGPIIGHRFAEGRLELTSNKAPYVRVLEVKLG